MSESEFELDLDELTNAEEFLEYFGVSYDPSVVHVNRLHILQRFHDYIENIEAMPEDEKEKRALYAGLLSGAYNDFINSDAQTEKVFKVFRMFEPVNVSIPLATFKEQVHAGAAEI